MLHTLKTHEHLKKNEKKIDIPFMTPFFLYQTRGALRISWMGPDQGDAETISYEEYHCVYHWWHLNENCLVL